MANYRGFGLAFAPRQQRGTRHEDCLGCVCTGIAGNGVSDDEFGKNCGLANFTGAPLNAINSYWGAATGPGAEPADVTCGNDPVISAPFARSPN